MKILTSRPASRGLLLFLLSLLLAACGESGRYSVTVISDGQHRIAAPDHVSGDLLVLGGDVVVARDAVVEGDLLLLLGSALVEGLVAGDVVQLGGALSLAPGAVIEGNLNLGGGTQLRSPGARIRGEVSSGTGIQLPERDVTAPAPGRGLLRLLGQTLLAVAIAFVVARLAPRPVGRLRLALVEFPALSAAVGLLSLIAIPSLLVLMAFTVVLIPVTMVGLVFGAGIIMAGGIGMGQWLGQALASRVGWEWPAPLQAAVGTGLLALAAEAAAMLPVVGIAVLGLGAALASGAALLTRLGSVHYRPPAQSSEAL